MKNTLISILLSLVLLTSVTVYAEDQNIVNVLNKTDDYSVFVAALQKVELTDTLKSDGSFTVFAPTNAAFDKLMAELQISAGDLLNHLRLKDLLLYHLVLGKISSTQMTNCLKPSTLLGQKLRIELVGGLQINNAFVVTADLEASNVIIHGIDTVLMPEFFQTASDIGSNAGLLETALANGKLSVLISALQNAGLMDQVNAEGQITVLAPGSDAFTNLLLNLDVSAEELLNNPQLSELLKVHVTADLIKNNGANNGRKPLISINEDLSVVNNKSIVDSATDAKVDGVLDAAVDVKVGNGVTDAVKDVVVGVVNDGGLLDLDLDIDLGVGNGMTNAVDDVITAVEDVIDEVKIPNPLKILP